MTVSVHKTIRVKHLCSKHELVDVPYNWKTIKFSEKPENSKM